MGGSLNVSVLQAMHFPHAEAAICALFHTHALSDFTSQAPPKPLSGCTLDLYISHTYVLDNIPMKMYLSFGF